MDSKSRWALSVGIAGLIGIGAVAGTAYADRRPGDDDRRHGWEDGHHGKGFMNKRVRKFAERYDTDKDGKISQSEVDANRTQWHGDFDADKDGGLTIEEFEKLWLKARREAMVREFQFFDRDGDARITIEEYKLPLSEVVDQFDRNGDGVLSRDDRPRRGEFRRDRSERRFHHEERRRSRDRDGDDKNDDNREDSGNL